MVFLVECDKPPTVTNGSMNCSISQIDNETKVCVAQCQDGYDFESDFMVINSTIFCGVNSSYRWNIRNEDNPNMKLPACFGIYFLFSFVNLSTLEG